MSVASGRNRQRRRGLRSSWRTCVVAVGCLGCAAVGGAEPAKVEFDSLRSYRYLLQICKIGPRPSGSRGMEEQRTLIVEHFSKAGAKVTLQEFDVPHPQTGRPVRMANVIVAWHPEAKERVLLCCHYDTRPYPDRDPRAPRGAFVGANDGASGVALFMEMAHAMKSLKPTYGVDFVLFDGEELVFDPTDKYFLGSEHFAKRYRDQPPEHRYVWGVLVDMIADRELQLYYEGHSFEDYAPELVKSIWGVARRLGVREFVPEVRHRVNDDHIPLNDVAKIPTCDLIDFDYADWHTTRDVPLSCSGASLKKVGTVLLTWLQEVPPRP